MTDTSMTDNDTNTTEQHDTPWAELLTDLHKEVRRIEQAVDGGDIGVRTYPEKATVTITYERGEDGSLYTNDD
jgi:hypothetical protein